MYASRPLPYEKKLNAAQFSSWKFPAWKLINVLLKTRNHAYKKNEIDMLRFEISSEKMHSLLSTRQLCATDVHCLDTSSKQCLQALCLKTCLLNTSYTSTQKEKIYDR